MLCWKPSRFRESFAKVGYCNHYMSRAATHCRPGSGRRRAPENASSSSQVSESEALREPNTKAPGLRFSFSAPPADGRGLWIGIFSRKFRESYAKERAKVKVHVEGGGPVNFAKKVCPEKGFRDASCMFKRLPRSDPWFSGVIWQVVNESS